jgi:hypothetical protein
MKSLKPHLLALAPALWLAVSISHADKLSLKDGKVIFGTILDEKDSVIRYQDRFDRPRKIASGLVDTIHYDSREVNGLVKIAFRKGQPKDRSGFFRLRHSEELDLDLEYQTDSVSELDLFFRNNVHVRILPGCRFKVTKAPKSASGEMLVELRSGSVLATSASPEAVARIETPWGAGVGRGRFQMAVKASPADSSMMLYCLRGLSGVVENRESPGELVVEEGKATSFAKREGTFQPGEPNAGQVTLLANVAANMGHYDFSPVAYPGIGYLPKAITGLGFMVFFYGSAIGILDYVNHI